MDAWMDVWMDGWMHGGGGAWCCVVDILVEVTFDGCVHGWMGGWIRAWCCVVGVIHARMDVWMDGWMCDILLLYKKHFWQVAIGISSCCYLLAILALVVFNVFNCRSDCRNLKSVASFSVFITALAFCTRWLFLQLFLPCACVVVA